MLLGRASRSSRSLVFCPASVFFEAATGVPSFNLLNTNSGCDSRMRVSLMESSSRILGNRYQHCLEIALPVAVRAAAQAAL